MNEDVELEMVWGSIVLTDRRFAVVGEDKYGENSKDLPLRDLEVEGVTRHYFEDLEETAVPGITQGWVNTIHLSLVIKETDRVERSSYFVGFIPDDEHLCHAVNEAIRTLQGGAVGSHKAAMRAHTTTIIQREIVKIPCRYCGTLNELTLRNCPSCGAPIR